MFKWKKYNGAIVSDEAPYIEPTAEDIQCAKIGKYLFISYVTDFDSNKEMPWWYIVKDTPIRLDEMLSRKRYKINKGLKYVYVKEISCLEYKEELYNCFVRAVEKYEVYELNISKESFFAQLNNDNAEYWAAFSKEDDKLVAYSRNIMMGNCVDFATIKFNPEYLKYQVSAALFYTMTNHYLENRKVAYCIDGQRSIRHKTNIQDYLQDHLEFRKAYCKLNIIYNNKMTFIVRFLFPFRKIIELIARNSVMLNNVVSVLKMEEIRRECEKT